MKINQITPREENNEVVELSVHFNGQIAGINFNGSLTLEQEEFTSFYDNEQLKNAVKQKIVEKIISGESPTE